MGKQVHFPRISLSVNPSNLVSPDTVLYAAANSVRPGGNGPKTLISKYWPLSILTRTCRGPTFFDGSRRDPVDFPLLRCFRLDTYRREIDIPKRLKRKI